MAWAAASVVVLAGCAGADDGSDRRSPDPLAPPAETHRLVETARIGSVDGPGDALTRVGALLPFPGGGAWFVEPVERRVRIVARDGGLRGQVGGPGQGPGEFTAPGPMGWWKGSLDTVWVADALTGMISLFATNGTFERSVRIRPMEWGDRWLLDQVAAVAPGGRGLGQARHRPGEAWSRFPVLAVELPDGEVMREVLSVDRTDAVQIQWRGETVASGGHPLSDAPMVAFAPRGTRIVVASRETAAGAEDPEVVLLAVDPRGDTLWQRSVRYRPESVPANELDALWRDRIEAFQGFVALEGRLTATEAEEAYLASVPRPGHRPPVSAVHLDAADRVLLLWSAPPEAETRAWLLDDRGDLAATFRVPPGQEVLGFDGDAVWLVEHDASGVPFIVRGRLEGT